MNNIGGEEDLLPSHLLLQQQQEHAEMPIEIDQSQITNTLRELIKRVTEPKQQRTNKIVRMLADRLNALGENTSFQSLERRKKTWKVVER